MPSVLNHTTCLKTHLTSDPHAQEALLVVKSIVVVFQLTCNWNFSNHVEYVNCIIVQCTYYSLSIQVYCTLICTGDEFNVSERD